MKPSWLPSPVRWLSSRPLARMLPFDLKEIARALLQLNFYLARHPLKLGKHAGGLLKDELAILYWNLRRLRDTNAEEALPAQDKDRRFADPAWRGNAAFSTLKQSYLALTQALNSAVQDAGELPPRQRQRMQFYLRQLTDALSPANFPLSNPVVLRETLVSRGGNLKRGFKNLRRDLKRGEISVTSQAQFKAGENLALTPGHVVHRNELMELIQYEAASSVEGPHAQHGDHSVASRRGGAKNKGKRALGPAPQTRQVHAAPILLMPPWINKFYVMDLKPGKSLAEYLVQQGFTVFMISWRNPGADQQHTGMDDYLRLGPLDAIKVIKSITGARRVNLTGYCLGGTLLSIALAYLAAAGDKSANSGTFFTALQDFEDVGETAIFITEDYVADIDQRMLKRGYLDAVEMSSIFRLMRSNDLIWNFVINNYWLGKEPLAQDLMYWSADGTRMPRAMHSWYLRNMYLENNLIKRGKLKLLGRAIDLSRIRCPTYVVAGSEDHIVPWASAHRSQHLFGKKPRLVLSHGGHITSIIAPPGRGHYFLSRERVEGSWWPDWVKWLKKISGKKRKPPAIGNKKYPALMPAPGQYVHET